MQSWKYKSWYLKIVPKHNKNSNFLQSVDSNSWCEVGLLEMDTTFAHDAGHMFHNSVGNVYAPFEFKSESMFVY